ncbi:hypothetical protein Rhal01_01551 [Rubritalea halochordaticola]|uniref:DUF2752 domain-containing protein n=1 Tax=Rubritalea halochordaticola TaxID=714537 RepID=A0ABP9UY43_9BACT
MAKAFQVLSEHWRKLCLAVLPLGCAVVAFLVYTKSALLPPCLFNQWTGLLCPGCGMTRASHSLLHGEIAAGFAYNPLGVVLLPALLYGVGQELIAWAWEKPEWRLRLGARLPLIMAILVIGFGILRNLPGFDFLRP